MVLPLIMICPGISQQIHTELIFKSALVNQNQNKRHFLNFLDVYKYLLMVHQP